MPARPPAIQKLGVGPSPKPKLKPLPVRKPKLKPNPGLSILRQAEKKAIKKAGGGLAGRILGKLAFRAVPVIGTLAPSAYDVGRMVQEGYGAVKANRDLKRTAKYVKEKHTALECIGFVDGMNAAIELMNKIMLNEKKN